LLILDCFVLAIVVVNFNATQQIKGFGFIFYFQTGISRSQINTALQFIIIIRTTI
jgi:hypothetical protein